MDTTDKPLSVKPHSVKTRSDKPLSVRIRPSQHHRLSQMAANSRTTVSDIMRDAVDDFLDEELRLLREKDEHEQTRAAIRNMANALNSIKAEHEQTRAVVRDIEHAMASMYEEIHAVKKVLESFRTTLSEHMLFMDTLRKATQELGFDNPRFS